MRLRWPPSSRVSEPAEPRTSLASLLFGNLATNAAAQNEARRKPPAAVARAGRRKPSSIGKPLLGETEDRRAGGEPERSRFRQQDRKTAAGRETLTITVGDDEDRSVFGKIVRTFKQIDARL